MLAAPSGAAAPSLTSRVGRLLRQSSSSGDSSDEDSEDRSSLFTPHDFFEMWWNYTYGWWNHGYAAESDSLPDLLQDDPSLSRGDTPKSLIPVVDQDEDKSLIPVVDQDEDEGLSAKPCAPLFEKRGAPLPDLLQDDSDLSRGDTPKSLIPMVGQGEDGGLGAESADFRGGTGVDFGEEEASQDGADSRHQFQSGDLNIAQHSGKKSDRADSEQVEPKHAKVDPGKSPDEISSRNEYIK